jgi:hypothetical protein
LCLGGDEVAGNELESKLEKGLAEFEHDLQVGIEYLATKFASRPDWVDVIRASCSKDKYSSLSFWSKPRINDREHRYQTDPIKIGGPGTESLIWKAMCSNGSYSAPTRDEGPVRTGKIDELVPPGNPIVRLVDHSNTAIYNITLPPHIFFPGSIRVQLSGTEVTVYGEGRGNFAYFNERGGFLLFTGIIERLRYDAQRNFQGQN